ncbi:S1/P1 nuclease [Alteromonas pelagimontana]|uniref:S1/P1 nuclease n=1 Tax=Alteromonas pelagimontana TaxID=1858656 RepID=A0A6M4MF39_9ALTE|nr:S1/P1 nuclease [Alteromonas pelagimontana]QJR81225.1 S1/P1 nuclease [Alteromonas pelagimontana]
MQASANRNFALTLCLLTGFITSLPAYGWGQTGHRVTGAIAERHLNPEAKAAIEALLPNESMAEASTYADEMRSDPDEFWQKISPPWHYVTVPEEKTYGEAGAPEHGDAYTALKRFTAKLKDPKATEEEKRLALRFVIHIIGDLHQPLHAGNGTDRGGNDVKVRFFWEDSNLHRVWDSQLLDQRKLSYTEWTDWLDEKITQQNISEWNTIKPEDWIAESTKIRDDLYPQDANNMSYDYLYDYLPIAKQRLQQAGIRMALYLNAVFGEQKEQ